MLLNSMTMREDWANEDELCQFLAHQLRRGRIGLILGAGISEPFGLPGWTKLVESMFATENTKPPSGTSLEDAAEYFRNTYFAGKTPAFLSMVHKVLYSGISVDFSALRGNAALASIAALVMGSRRGNAPEVINFNYDNLLETYLDYHGFVTRPIHEETDWASGADALVYHPHGYLPRDEKLQKSKDIVFDQHSYSKIVGQESNPWRQRVLTMMRSRICVFVGLSGRDANLDSFILGVSEVHPCRREGSPFWGVAIAISNDAVAQSKWERRGVYYKVLQKEKLPEFFFAICQEAARQASAA